MSLEQKKLINQFISAFGFDPFAQQDAQEVPPANCRQRLKLEGKAYPRSGCAVCGQLSPYQKKCDAMLTAAPTPPSRRVGLTPEEISRVYTEQTGSAIEDSPWALGDFARAVIEAYENKNGLKP